MRPRRRSLGVSTPTKSPGLQSLGNNDDREERRRAQQKRKSLGRRPSLFATPLNSKRAGQISTPRALNWSVRRTPRQKLEAPALNTMYEKVLQRATKGRITRRNAWEIPICSYVKEIIDMEKGNFPRSATVIDAASQVLVMQIDDAHDRGQRVLRRLNDKKARLEEDRKDAAKKKRAQKRKSIVPPNQIAVKISGIVAARDPLFEKTAAMFDEGGVKGLMLNNLQTQAGKIVFNCDDSLNAYQPLGNINDDQLNEQTETDLMKLMEARISKVVGNKARDILPANDSCLNVVNFYERQTEKLEEGLDIVDGTFEDAVNMKKQLDFDESIIHSDDDGMGEDFDLDLPDLNINLEVEEEKLEIEEKLELEEQLNIEPLPEELGLEIDFNLPREMRFHQSFATDSILKDESWRQNFENLNTYFKDRNAWAGPRQQTWRSKRLESIRKRTVNENLKEKMKRASKRRKVNYFKFVIPETADRNVKEDELDIESIGSLEVDEDERLMLDIMQGIDERLFEEVDRRKNMLPKRELQSWKKEFRILAKDEKLTPAILFKCSLLPRKIFHCPEGQDVLPEEEAENCIDLGPGADEDENDSLGPALPFGCEIDDPPLFSEQDLREDNSEKGPDISDSSLNDLKNPLLGENFLGEILTGIPMNFNKENRLNIPFVKDPIDINVSAMKKSIWAALKELLKDRDVVRFEELLEHVMFSVSFKTATKLTVHVFYVCLLYCCNEYKLRLECSDNNELGDFKVYLTEKSPHMPVLL